MNSILDLKINDLNGHESFFEICVGDILKTEPDEVIDLLCISAFPDNYVPTFGTLIKGLGDKGVSVDIEASNKAYDWRSNWQCWISHPLTKNPLPIERLLCFEHGELTDAATVVGNIFRSIREFILQSPKQPLKLIRLPLLSTGNQGFNKIVMLEEIMRQIFLHLKAGLPVHKVQLVLYSNEPNINKILISAGIFAEKNKSEWVSINLAKTPKFDYFVSYRRNDSRFVDKVLNAIKLKHTSTKFFIDGKSIDDGFYWKPQLIKGLYESRKVLCFITDTYANSIECIDEFHAALCCSQYRDNFMKPLLCIPSRDLTTLPRSIQRVQLIDAVPPRSLSDLVDQICSN